MDPTALETLWFLLIAVLWIGYFFLEGFDFGVGMLLPRPGARRRRAARRSSSTIGPVWDGNEVWLLMAGGATFAAFPEWYATLFSGFYLALFLILVALIVRGVAFEFRAKHDAPALACDLGRGDRRRQRRARRCCGASPSPTSCAACPSTPASEYAGTLLDLLNPYALLGGLTPLLLFAAHGAIFLALRTAGRPARAGPPRSPIWPLPAAVAVGPAFIAWTVVARRPSLGPRPSRRRPRASAAAVAVGGRADPARRGARAWPSPRAAPPSAARPHPVRRPSGPTS